MIHVPTEDTPFNRDAISKNANFSPRDALRDMAARLPQDIPELNSAPCAQKRALPNGVIQLGGGSPNLVYFGDKHGLIVPFLQDAVEREAIILPLSVLNFDYHSDIAPYDERIICHTASWQRAGVDQVLWLPEDSFNVRPSHSTAKLTAEFQPKKYIRDCCVGEIPAELSFDLVSVDLDYFNHVDPCHPGYQEGLLAIERAVQHAKVVMIFSSSGWTADFKRGEFQSNEQITALTASIFGYCIGGREREKKLNINF